MQNDSSFFWAQPQTASKPIAENTRIVKYIACKKSQAHTPHGYTNGTKANDESKTIRMFLDTAAKS